MGSFTTNKSHSIMLFLLLGVFFHNVHCVADFSWRDCGVQLTKDIHYESATISQKGDILSINVGANIVNMIYGADTRLIVFKDHELFLDVEIQNLCDIISTTKSLSCPLKEGFVSFTYSFDKIPPMPKGFYEFQIRSYINYIGTERNYAEQGCISLSGTVGSLGKNTKSYTSSFSVTVAGAPTFTVDDFSQRTIGHSLAVGMSGRLGEFSTILRGSEDVGGDVSLSDYQWSLDGNLETVVPEGLYVKHGYSGFFFVYNADDNTVFAQGEFNLSHTIHTTGAEEERMEGTLALNPKYMYNSQKFKYPVVLGNLGPFQIKKVGSTNWEVKGNRTWCTGGVDKCGVCEGDGSTCGSAVDGLGRTVSPNNNEWSDRQKAAVAIGVGGGVLGIIVITILALMITRAKRQPYYDDTDLIDHPQKPDYGTMAIDDIMREGERAPY